MSGVAAYEDVPAPPRRPAGERTVGGAGFLSAAMTVSGALAYLFHVLAARTLGSEAYGQIAVLWAAMFIVVVVVFRPLEQTTTRAIADRLARGSETVSVLRSIALVFGGILCAVLVVGIVFWDATARTLFVGSDTLTAALLVGVVGYGFAYVTRGVCAGVRWFRGYGLLLLVDAGARLAIAAPLVLVASKAVAAVACAAAGIGSAVAATLSSGRRLRPTRLGSSDSPFAFRAAVSFAAPAGVIAAADQILVNGGPLLVMLGDDGTAKTAGIVFAATMLVRAPVYVFQGTAASLLPNLTTMQATQARGMFNALVVRVVLVSAGLSLVIAVGATAVGSQTLKHVYGPEFVVAGWHLGLLGLGVGAYLAAVTLVQALLALDRPRAAAGIWAVAAGVFLAAYFVVPGDPMQRISIGFAGSTVLAAVLLALEAVRRRAR